MPSINPGALLRGIFEGVNRSFLTPKNREGAKIWGFDYCLSLKLSER